MIRGIVGPEQCCGQRYRCAAIQGRYSLARYHRTPKDICCNGASAKRVIAAWGGVVGCSSGSWLMVNT